MKLEIPTPPQKPTQPPKSPQIKKRKIVQITAVDGNEYNRKSVIFALCNDGSVWSLPITEGDLSTRIEPSWKKLKDIP